MKLIFLEGDYLEKLKEIDEACDRGHEFLAYSQLGFSDEEIGEFYGYSPAVIAIVLALVNGDEYIMSAFKVYSRQM